MFGMGNTQLISLAEELKALKERGDYWTPGVLWSGHQGRAKFDDRVVVNLSSNDYLGLTHHLKVKKATIDAVRRYGCGIAAGRTFGGNTDLHEKLDRKIAEFKQTEAALSFQSGFLANQGSLQSLLTKDDMVFSDELNHVSIVAGCRLSGAEIELYPHTDVGELEDRLRKDTHKKRLIVTECVFMTGGDLAPMPELVKLAEEYDAILYADDAHGTGVMGESGRGTIHHFGLQGRVPISMGTLSKALGSVGGYIAGSSSLREYLMHRATPQSRSTALPPHNIAASIAAIDVLLTDPKPLSQLWENAAYFKKGLRELGFDTGDSKTPITPILVGENREAQDLSRGLYDNGVLVQPFLFPAIHKERPRLRTIVTAMHTRADLDIALKAFKRVGKKLGLIT